MKTKPVKTAWSKTKIISYAQNREDIILSGFFPEDTPGFYIDIGANHPIEDSVTKIFYDKGWSGLNIEPNKNMCRLLDLDRPRDKNLNIGLGNKEDELTFREYLNHGLSTFSKPMQESYTPGSSGLTDNFKEYQVPVKSLKNVLQDQKVGKISFMKVDVEGFEYEVLSGNDWNTFRPAVICIESNHIIKDWRPILKDNGYKLAFYDGLNDYYLAKEAAGRLKSFSYPDLMLLRHPVISWKTYLEHDALYREKTINEYKLTKRINELENRSHHPVGFKKRLKATLQALDASLASRLLPSSTYEFPTKAASNEDLRRQILDGFFLQQPSPSKLMLARFYFRTRRALKLMLRLLRRMRKLLPGGRS